MRHVGWLAWRYIRHHRGKSLLMVAALTLTIFMPLAVDVGVTTYHAQLLARAQDTPLVAGAKGSRFDLAMHALYFRGPLREHLTAGQVDDLRATDAGGSLIVPLHLRHTARGAPVVGVTLDYFEARGLRVAPGLGTLPLRLGDCVVGHAAAAEFGIAPGSRLLTDAQNVFDLAGPLPLRMRVSGVLAPTGGPDDGAVFVDLKTAWVVDGLGHGHTDVVKAGDAPGVVLSREGGHVTAGAALPSFNEITADNMSSFHFHGDEHAFPVTAVLIWPRDAKASALLQGRLAEYHSRAQALEPLQVVDELMGMVFRIKRFFDAQMFVTALAAVLFLVLIVGLSVRLRARERHTMYKIGCSRVTVFAMHAVELLLLAGMALVLSLALTVGLVTLSPYWMRLLWT